MFGKEILVFKKTRKKKILKDSYCFFFVDYQENIWKKVKIKKIAWQVENKNIENMLFGQNPNPSHQKRELEEI